MCIEISSFVETILFPDVVVIRYGSEFRSTSVKSNYILDKNSFLIWQRSLLRPINLLYVHHCDTKPNQTGMAMPAATNYKF